MKRATLLCLVLSFTACDGPPPDATTDPVVNEAPYCTLDPNTLTTDAAYNETPGGPSWSCDALDGQTDGGRTVRILEGYIGNAPIKITDVKVYDGTSVGVRCVYDLRGFADPTGSADCSTHVNFSARVLVQ